MSNANAQNSHPVPDGFAFGSRSGGSVAVAGAQPFVDADLLFSGSYDRIGADLVICSETRSVTIHEYFKGEHRPMLMSPEGAGLSGTIVEAMTARAQYAQADQIASAVDAVGNVAKVMGSAVVTRNGVTVDLKQGDRLLKGDVVQTGTDTTLGISFVDGTALGLASNARIVLDEMTYDPNGSSNSSLLSLVQGTITLVAGHTAKYGNMRVETPVATMGIRGTAVLVEIAADDGPTKFSVLSEPNGKTGAFNLYDKGTGELIRVVSHAGYVTLVSPLGPGQPVSAIDQLKTLTDLQNEKNLVQQVFQIYFPNYSPDGRTGSSSNPLANTSVTDAARQIDSGVPGLIALAAGASIIPIGTMAQDLLIFPEAPPAPAVTAIAITNVVDVQATPGPVERNFAISDQVTITIDGQVIEGSAGRYVPGTGAVTGFEITAPTPQGARLANLVHVDPAAGVVSYDPSAFAFLGVGESAVYTIGFGSQSGSSVVPETLTLTINGLNDAPTVEHSIPDQRIKEGCRFEYVIPACVFADLDTNDTLTYRATLANGDPLPSWLTFDPVTLTFSGTPPKGEDCVLHLAVIASDEHDATAVDQFDLVIKDDHHDHHHYHHHHWFDDDQMNGATMASHEHDLVSVGGDLSSGTGDATPGNDREEARPATETRESESAGCGEMCSRDSLRAGNDSSVSSREPVSSSSDEHRSQNMSSNQYGGNGGGHESAFGPASTALVSNDSTDPHMGWSRYSSDSNSTHDSFVATSHNLTFTWTGSFANSHSSFRDSPGVDSFVFRSDFGRDMTSDARSSPDVMLTGGYGSENLIDFETRITESFDRITVHDENTTVLRQVTSTEIHTHQSYYHLV
jgi:hypothetical protein